MALFSKKKKIFDEKKEEKELPIETITTTKLPESIEKKYIFIANTNDKNAPWRDDFILLNKTTNENVYNFTVLTGKHSGTVYKNITLDMFQPMGVGGDYLEICLNKDFEINSILMFKDEHKTEILQEKDPEFHPFFVNEFEKISDITNLSAIENLCAKINEINKVEYNKLQKWLQSDEAKERQI